MIKPFKIKESFVRGLGLRGEHSLGDTPFCDQSFTFGLGSVTELSDRFPLTLGVLAFRGHCARKFPHRICLVSDGGS